MESTTMSATRHALASVMYRQFEQRTRDNRDTYWCLGDNRPQWMVDVALAAHDYGRMLPDDLRYEFIHEAIGALLEDTVNPWVDASETTYLLTGWLHSRNDRYTYCDEALADGFVPGDSSSTIALLQAGMQREMDETLWAVIGALDTLAGRTLHDWDYYRMPGVADEWTVVTPDYCLSMSSDPTHPQGVSSCGEPPEPGCRLLREGEPIDFSDLPEAVQRHVVERLLGDD